MARKVAAHSKEARWLREKLDADVMHVIHHGDCTLASIVAAVILPPELVGARPSRAVIERTVDRALQRLRKARRIKFQKGVWEIIA